MVDDIDGVFIACATCGERRLRCSCFPSLDGGGGGSGMSIEDEDRRQRKWEEQQRRKREWEERERKEQERKEQERELQRRYTVSGGSLVIGMMKQLFSFRRKEKHRNHSSSTMTTSTKNISHKSRKEQIKQYEEKYLTQIEQQHKESTLQQNDMKYPLVKLSDGIGYRVKKGQEHIWADQTMIAFIENIGKKWDAVHPGKNLVINEISKKGGGELVYSSDGKVVEHVEHQRGLDVDIRPFRNDTLDAGTTWMDKKHYDRKLMREFLDLLHADSEVKQIYFNDDVLLKENHPSLPQKRYPKMITKPEHDNHVHISLD